MQAILQSIKSQEQQKEIADMIKTAEEVMKEEGRDEGRDEGRAEGELNKGRQILLRVLTHRLGQIPATWQKQIDRTKDIKQLDAWIDAAMNAESWDDMK